VRKLFVQNKSGFVVPVDFLLKPITDLHNGIFVAGMFTKSQHPVETNTMLINGQTGEIVGITEGCCDNFGVVPSVCFGNNSTAQGLSILTLFPEVTSLEDIREKQVTTSLQLLSTQPLAVNLMLNLIPETDEISIKPNQQLLKDYQVRLEIENEEVFEPGAFSLIQLHIRENKQYLYLKSNQQEEQRAQDRVKKKSEASVPGEAAAAERQVIDLIDGPTELTEEETKQLMQKNETERKIREQRQIIKRKQTDKRILYLYLISGCFFFAAMVVQASILRMKYAMLGAVLDEDGSTTDISQRNSIVPDLVSSLMRLNRSLHLAPELAGHQREVMHRFIGELQSFQQKVELAHLQIIQSGNRLVKRSANFVQKLSTGQLTQLALTNSDLVNKLVIDFDLLQSADKQNLEQTAERNAHLMAFDFVLNNYHSLIPHEFDHEQATFFTMYQKTFSDLFVQVIVQYSMLLLACSLCIAVLFRNFQRIHLKMARVMEVFKRISPDEASRFVQGCECFGSKWLDENQRLSRMRQRPATNSELKSHGSRKSSEAKMSPDDETTNQKKLNTNTKQKLKKRATIEINDDFELEQLNNLQDEKTNLSSLQPRLRIVPMKDGSEPTKLNQKKAQNRTILSNQRPETEANSNSITDQQLNSYKIDYMGEALWRMALISTAWLALCSYAFSRDLRYNSEHRLYYEHTSQLTYILFKLKLLNALTFDIYHVSGSARRAQFDQLVDDLQKRVYRLSSAQTSLSFDRYAASFSEYVDSHRQLIEKNVCAYADTTGDTSLKNSRP